MLSDIQRSEFQLTLAQYTAKAAENYGDSIATGRMGSRMSVEQLIWLYDNYADYSKESVVDLTDDEQIMFALFICEAEGIDWENAE